MCRPAAYLVLLSTYTAVSVVPVDLSEHGFYATASCSPLHRHRGMDMRIRYYCDRGPIHAASARVGLCKCCFYRGFPMEHTHCWPAVYCPRATECVRHHDGGPLLQWLRGAATRSARRAARTSHEFSCRL